MRWYWSGHCDRRADSPSQNGHERLPSETLMPASACDHAHHDSCSDHHYGSGHNYGSGHDHWPHHDCNSDDNHGPQDDYHGLAGLDKRGR